MQSNPGIQNTGTIGWDGTASRAMDIRKYVHFGFAFEVIAALGADTVFKVQAAPPSAGNPAVPGDFVDVEAVPVCMSPVEPGALATFTIKAGTPVGTVCSGTIPCRPDAFVKIVPVSGETADVRVVNLRQGPMI